MGVSLEEARKTFEKRKRYSGVDEVPLEYETLQKRRQELSFNLFGDEASATANYGVFYIAPQRIVVESVRERHGRAASSKTTFDVVRVADGVDTSNGTSVLRGVISGTATADTVQNPNLSSTPRNVQLLENESLAVIGNEVGVGTPVTDLTITIEITR